MKNKYNISYTPSSDNKRLMILIWTPLKEFNEGEPIFNEEEVLQVVKFIEEYPVPIPKEINDWNDFRLELNKHIYNLYGK